MTRTPAQILAELGIRRRRGLAAWSTVCPRCSPERRKKTAQCLSVLIDDRGVRWNCNHCGWHGGQFFDAVGGTNGAIAVPMTRKVSSSGKSAPSPDNNNANGRRAAEIWRASGHLLGSPGLDYLRSRGISEFPPGVEDALRFNPSCPFDGSRRPCIIGLFRDVLTNEPKAIHRISIDGGGKLSLGPKSGCAIKLSPDEDVEQGLAVGEGVETMLAAWQHGFRPAWACGDAANLCEFPVLSGIEHLTVVVDNDPADERGCRKGPEAAAKCSATWTAAGRHVSRIVPKRLGADFNDIICGKIE